MTLLTLTPTGLGIGLELTRDETPDVVLHLEPAPQPEITLDLTAGLPPAAPDLEPVLEAIAAIPVPQPTDLTPLLDAIAAIPVPAPVDLSPTLEAIATIPKTDVAADLAAYGVATDAEVAAAVAALRSAIDSLPVPDVSSSLVSYDAAKGSDLANALATLQEAIAGVVNAGQLDEVAATLAKAADLSALIATTSTLATKDQLANVQHVLLAALAGIPPALLKGQVIDVALDAQGKVPAGLAPVNGTPSVPMSGLHAYFGKGTTLATAASTSLPVQGTDGTVYCLHNSALYSWSKAQGFIAGVMASHPTPNNNAALALLPSGRLISLGATLGTAAYANCWAGDLATGTWSPLRPMPAPRSNLTLTVLTNGEVVAIGGSTQSTASAAGLTDRVETYVESSNQWVTGPSAPVRGYGPSILLPSGRVLWAPRGISDGSTLTANLNRFFIYDPSAPPASAWSETDVLIAGAALSGATAFVADGAGALLLYAGSGIACRYTEDNAPGARWSLLDFDCMPPVASTARGGNALRLADGTVFVPQNSSWPILVSVQYNPGNQIIKARKL